MTSPSTPILGTHNLIKSYGEHNVLKGLNLSIYPGEIYGFIGHNGAGKSTTMQLMMKLLSPDGGTIHKALHNPQQIGYLPEAPEFFPYMSAVQYLNYIGETGGHSKKHIKQRSDELLALVDLTEKSRRPIGGYSRGMKQRLGLAVALYHNPDLLLLDEPSSALDPLGRQAVVTILEQLKSQGKTIFLSTHILDDIERVCDRIGVLQGGLIAVEGPLQQLLDAAGGQDISVTFSDETPESLRKSLIKELEEVLKQTYPEYLPLTYHWNTPKDLRITPMDTPKVDQNPLLSALFSLAAKQPEHFKSIERHKATLEDLYMKVVTA